jgi:hypothetical protein
MFDAAREGDVVAAIDAGAPISQIQKGQPFHVHTLHQHLLTRRKTLHFNRQHVFDALDACRSCRALAWPRWARGIQYPKFRTLNYIGQAPIAGAIFEHEDEVVQVLMEAGAER